VEVRVDCYAGYKADEAPLRFWLGERKIEVVRIIDRWIGPDHQYFKVEGDDGAAYILRRDIPEDTWSLTMFDGTGGGEGRMENAE
jgi:hypothetical protein